MRQQRNSLVRRDARGQMRRLAGLKSKTVFIQPLALLYEFLLRNDVSLLEARSARVRNMLVTRCQFIVEIAQRVTVNDWPRDRHAQSPGLAPRHLSFKIRPRDNAAPGPAGVFLLTWVNDSDRITIQKR